MTAEQLPSAHGVDSPADLRVMPGAAFNDRVVYVNYSVVTDLFDIEYVHILGARSFYRV